jgi:hypothetical protein
VIYERTFDDAFPSIEYSVELSDTSTFSMDRFSKCNNLNIRRIDQIGNSNDDWLGEAFLYGYHWIGHDSILLWYETGSYDVGPDSFRVEIWTPKNKKVLVREEVEHQNIPGRRYGAYLYQQNQIIYEKSDTFLRKNLVTGENDKFVFFQRIQNVIEFKNSILIYFSAPFPKLVDADFNIIRNLHNPLPFDTTKAVVLDSFWIGQDSNDLQTVNALNVYTEIIRPIDFTIFLDTIEDIQVNKGALFIKGKKGDIHKVVELNESLEIYQIHDLDLPSDPENITYRYSPGRVYSHFTDGLGAYKADYRICYPFLDPNPVHYVDIQLDSMWLSSIIHHQFYSEIQVAFQITNLSTDTIHSFTLHYDNNEPYSTCFTGTNALHFKELDIIPGNSTTIDYHDYTTAFEQGSKLSRSYFVEHGNHHLDGDTSNNVFNLEYLITSSDDLISDRIQIYPNPFTDIINIFNQGQSFHLNLSDQMGRVVSRGIDHLDHLSDLPSGIYFLQIHIGHQIFIRKVIKGEE